MTTYKLPEWLGGHECDLKDLNKSDGFARVRFVLNGHEVWIDIDYMQLVKVAPPLPPEPPVGAVMLDGADVAWQRIRDDGSVLHWRHDGERRDWAEMAAAGPLTLLVPDPAADAGETFSYAKDGNEASFSADLLDGEQWITVHVLEKLVFFIPMEFTYGLAGFLLRAHRERGGA
jgi:hypothetical protein